MPIASELQGLRLWPVRTMYFARHIATPLFFLSLSLGLPQGARSSEAQVTRKTKRLSDKPAPNRLKGPIPPQSLRSTTTLRLKTDARQSSPILARKNTKHLLRAAGISDKRIADVAKHVALGMPSRASLQSQGDFLLARNEYVVSYNHGRRSPNWASWRLQAADLANGPRQEFFREDHSLPLNWAHAQNADYQGSGYTRGHLVASGERQANTRANAKTFVFSNILPQSRESNLGPWSDLELHCKQEAITKNLDVYLSAGGIYEGAKETIGIHSVAVPSSMWKVAVFVKAGQNPSADSITRVLAVIVPNHAGEVKQSQPFTEFRVTPATIESRTGLQLFQHLPLALRTQVRRQLDKELGNALSRKQRRALRRQEASAQNGQYVY